MKIERLKCKMDEIMECFGIPSYSAAVCAHGETATFTGGLRDLESAAAPDEQTLYAIGSCTKSFTAGAICTLVDRGLLSLDDPVKKYLPDLSMYDGYTSAHLTVRDMLCHRCGVPGYSLLWVCRADTATEGDVLASLRHMTPSTSLRYKFQYSNTMFALAGILIRRITGKAWQQVVRENIFAPLGIERAAFSAKEAMTLGNVASPYITDAGSGEHKVIPAAEIGPVGPAGCLYMTPGELLKWDMTLLGGGEYQGKRILSAEMAREMAAPQMIRGSAMTPAPLRAVVHNETYGLGLMSEVFEGHRLIHHAGNIDGFSAHQCFLPDDGCAFAVATNENGSLSSIAMQYAASEVFIGGEHDWGVPCHETEVRGKAMMRAMSDGLWAAKPADAPCPIPLADICGVYENDVFGTLEIFAKGEALAVRCGSIELSCRHYANHYFYLGGPTIAPELLIEACVDLNIRGEVAGFSAAMEFDLKEKIHFRRVNN